MKNLTLALWALILIFAARAEAYVTYNRLGYISCSACHFMPTGGGLLTPYGMGVESAMSLFSKELDAPEKSYYAGVQARAIELDSSSRANPFLMQADVLGTAFVTQYVHADIAAGPNLQQGEHSFATVSSGWNGVVLRRAMVTATLSDSSSIQVGRDYAVSGLNLDDHTSFLKSQNRRGVFDYPTQLRYIYQGDQLQLIPYLAAPSYEESDSNREYGGGVRAEYALNSSNSVGMTGLFGNSPAITRLAGGPFIRLSGAHWNGLDGEALFTLYDTHATHSVFSQEDVYIKPYVAVPEWIETGLVYEYLKVASPYAEQGFQFGPEINLRIQRYFSLIGDARDLGLAGDSSWSWYGQLFFHFEI